MWDLTIPGDHDFYVVSGSVSVLVHNVNGECPITKAEAKARALADAGVPDGAEPLETRMEPATTPPYQGGKQIFDESHNPIEFQVATYETSDGDLIDLQDHHTGHFYGEDNPGNQPPHFNVRPFDGERNEQYPETDDHYPYNPALG
jgi:hypothetical protein